jgi:hypothetical protein
MSMLMLRLIGLAALLASCAPSEAPVSAAEYDADAPLNPKLSDGRLLFRGFDDHHPSCFVLESSGEAASSGDTETVECPAAALEVLADCPGGTLFAGKGGGQCVCVPLADEPASRVACP